MNIKYMGENAISYLIEKCKSTFALITHKHTAQEVGADVEGSASAALVLAQQHTEEKVGELAINVAYIDGEDNEDIINPDISMSDVVVDSMLSETSMNPVQNKIVTEKINELEGNIVTSWNELEDKPFYEGEPEEFWPLPQIVVEDSRSLSMGLTSMPAVQIEVGKIYEVLHNDKTYSVECYQGNIGPSVGDSELQEYPFYIFDGGFASMLTFTPQTEPLIFSIKGYDIPIKELERKFVKDIAGMDVEGKVFTYNDKEYVGYRYAEIFNDYDNNIAFAPYSHAEGYHTVAFGTGAHAEGGLSEARGNGSHAEGDDTIAEGISSHSEGSGTIASSDYQHVQGKYNIEDTEDKYAHIVGNGKSTADGDVRSNAHTLDWKGNAEFAGDVKVNACGGEKPISLIALAGEISELQSALIGVSDIIGGE